MKTLVLIMLLVVPMVAQEANTSPSHNPQPVENIELIALRAELDKAVKARGEALVKALEVERRAFDAVKATPEYQTYEAAVKLRESLR